MRRNNNPMQQRGGPLMTDHLQDLELELELLKRKRQMIQLQQSDMLYNRRDQGYGGNMGYNEPSQSYNDKFNEPQRLNFSHLYNDAPRSNQAFGLKRQAQADWPTSSANNMGGNKRSRPNPFNQPFQNNQGFQNNTQSFQNNKRSFQRPGFNQPQPLLSTPKPRPLMNFPVQSNRPANRPNMRQNHGSKPLTHHPNFKQNQGPKPLTHHTNFKQGKPANRPGFVPKKPLSPKKPVQTNPSPTKKIDKQERNVFIANKKPTPKMNGRLELALGMVVKEIRATYGNQPEYKSLFNLAPLTRLMKQAIRERVHTAMLGKTVDRVNDIMAEYRQRFPMETDKEVLEQALFEQKKHDQKIELAITLFEEGDPEQYFKKNMTKLLQVRFDQMMGKLEKVITEESKVMKDEILGNLPEIKKTPEDAAAAETKAGEETAKPEGETSKPEEETAKPEGETAKPEGETANAEPTPEKVESESAEKVEETPKKVEDSAEKVEDTPKPDETAVKEAPMYVRDKEENYDKWLSLYIERKLPALVHRHRSNILKIFDLDLLFSTTKAAIIRNATNKALAMKARTNDNEKGNGDPMLPRHLPYFAKVHASPMPKRKQMQEFINQFEPKTIKRHKKNYNLLFIGFDSKDNYDKILAANQTKIGNTVLNISGNTTKAPTAEVQDDQADIDQVLTPQLDDQINDLLTSIRKADEESKASGDETVENVDLTNDDGQEEETDRNNKVEETETSKQTAANEETTVEGSDNANGNDNKTDDCEVVEANGNNVVTIEDDDVAPLKDEVKKPATPAKGKAPATPRSVNTRRSSRLQN